MYALGVDLAGGEPLRDLGHGQRADLLLVDDHVPGRLVASRRANAAAS
jgi:hypothetical protein